jgi:hypothetical protein
MHVQDLTWLDRDEIFFSKRRVLSRSKDFHRPRVSPFDLESKLWGQKGIVKCSLRTLIPMSLRKGLSAWLRRWPPRDPMDNASDDQPDRGNHYCLLDDELVQFVCA